MIKSVQVRKKLNRAKRVVKNPSILYNTTWLACDMAYTLCKVSYYKYTLKYCEGGAPALFKGLQNFVICDYY